MPGFLVGPVTGFVDRMKGKGTCSSSFLQQVGKSSAQSAGGGNIFSQLNAAGVGNGADTTVDTLMSCILPMNILDVPGRCITVQAFGSVTATSSTLKNVNFVFGAGINQQTIQYATTTTGTWQLNVQIYKISANVQGILMQADATGTVNVFGVTAGRALVYSAGSETDTAAINIKITGQSTSASTANIILCNGLIVDGYN